MAAYGRGYSQNFILSFGESTAGACSQRSSSIKQLNLNQNWTADVQAVHIKGIWNSYIFVRKGN